MTEALSSIRPPEEQADEATPKSVQRKVQTRLTRTVPEKLAPGYHESQIFRRWPALNKIELNEIRRLHDERQRLARYVGMLRRR